VIKVQLFVVRFVTGRVDDEISREELVIVRLRDFGGSNVEIWKLAQQFITKSLGFVSE
jgi:hypothetical protein